MRIDERLAGVADDLINDVFHGFGDRGRLPRDAKWTLRRGQEPLEGITLLETDALAAPAAQASQGLYRRLPKGELRPFRLTLIPYYAWNNRGQTEMTVWLPVH